MGEESIFLYPHRRYNPLTDTWVLVSPQRTKRPWLGRKEKLASFKNPVYDPCCYMCPGNKRASGEKNSRYSETYIFPNDFPAITPTNNLKRNSQKSEFFKFEPVQGKCEVICFSPTHNLTLSEMSLGGIEKVIQTWIKEIKKFKKKYQWIQIFENKGEMMGCSNPHPHGQIWASNFLPTELQKEDKQQKKYFKKYHSPLLFDYLQEELSLKERIILENENWVILIPFWAIWPFETLLLPQKHKICLTNLSSKEISKLAEIMKQLLLIYNRLFNTPMPYSMGWHFAPFNGKNNSHWCLHAHYYPPLLRSAYIRKFIVGYEMLAESQRDITPEEAAEKLKNILKANKKSKR